MRLWSLHPTYLDSKGLVAAWREGLLAQGVLEGRTRGYRHHPQLARFLTAPHPVAAIGRYLAAIYAEATRRGYHFDITRIHEPGSTATRIPVTSGQLRYEQRLLAAKLARRAPDRTLPPAGRPRPHPLFRSVEGGVAAWERVKPELLE